MVSGRLENKGGGGRGEGWGGCVVPTECDSVVMEIADVPESPRKPEALPWQRHPLLPHSSSLSPLLSTR